MKNARTDPFIQTDLSLHHEIAVHEGERLNFEVNVINVFNQRAVQGVYEFAVPSGTINPTRASRFPGDPRVDWNKVMTGYNYVDALNGAGAFAGVQNKLTLASRYGMPNLFQTGRSIRLAVHFVF